MKPLVPPRTIAQILRERVRREPTDATATRLPLDLESVQQQASAAGAGSMQAPSGIAEEPLGYKVARIGTELTSPLPVSIPEMFDAGKKLRSGDTKGAVRQAGAEGLIALLTAGVGKKIKAGKDAAKLGREALENSPLIARPIDFKAGKDALGKVFRSEAEQPLPAEMRDKPLIEMSHSSPYLFRAPKIDREVAGSGAGDYWQAPGFYGTTSVGPNSVEANYREGTAYLPSMVKMPSGIPLDRDRLFALGRKAFRDELPVSLSAERKSLVDNAITRMLSGSDVYYDSPKELKAKVKKLRGDAKKTYEQMQKATGQDKSDLREQFLDYMDLLSEARGSLDVTGRTARLPTKIPQDFRQATYNAQFAASTDELFDLERSVADQPASERILAALRGMRNPAKPNESLAEALANMERRGMSPYRANEMLVGNKYMGGADMFSGLDRFGLMNELNARGIVGNRYLTKFAQENPNIPRTYNYVAQDPSRVRLTDVWAAAPIGLAMGAGQQREQTPPKRKAAPTSKKRESK